MFLAQIDFALDGQASQDVEQTIFTLLGIWRKNGQIIGREGSLIRYPHGLRATQLLPTRSALQLKNNNVHAKEYLIKLKSLQVSSPKISILGAEIGGLKACRCKSRSSLILFTTYARTESPLSCGHCFAPVPLYATPHTSGDDHSEIIGWETAYKAIDDLNMGCGVGERMAEREMSDANGALSRQGRAICEKIAEKTSLPTYYFLYKHRGVSYQTEKKRKCPGCGGKWLREKSRHENFDFRCDKCSLLSMIAGSLRSYKE